MSALFGIGVAVLFIVTAVSGLASVVSSDPERLRHVLFSAVALLGVSVALGYSVSIRAAVVSGIVGSIATSSAAAILFSDSAALAHFFLALVPAGFRIPGEVVPAIGIAAAISAAGTVDFELRDLRSYRQIDRARHGLLLVDAMLFIAICAICSIAASHVLIAPLQRTAKDGKPPDGLWIAALLILLGGSFYSVWVKRSSSSRDDRVIRPSKRGGAKLIVTFAVGFVALSELLREDPHSYPYSFVVGLVTGLTVGGIYSAIHAALVPDMKQRIAGVLAPLAIMLILVILYVPGAIAHGASRFRDSIVFGAMASFLLSHLLMYLILFRRLLFGSRVA